MVLAALMTLFVALPAQAAEPGTVNVLNCDHFQGGTQSVPRRTDINLTIAWAAKTRAQLRQFRNNVKVTARIDGVRVESADSYWGGPHGGPGLWAVTWTYPAGQLRRGQSFTVTLQMTLLAPVYDGYTHSPKGPFFDPRLQCQVEAA